MRYWDGSRWTDALAPLPPPPPPAPTSWFRQVRIIAAGIVLGFLVLGALAWFFGGIQQAQDDQDHLDCLSENVDRSLSGEPERYCP